MLKTWLKYTSFIPQKFGDVFFKYQITVDREPDFTLPVAICPLLLDLWSTGNASGSVGLHPGNRPSRSHNSQGARILFPFWHYRRSLLNSSLLRSLQKNTIIRKIVDCRVIQTVKPQFCYFSHSWIVFCFFFFTSHLALEVPLYQIKVRDHNVTILLQWLKNK